MKKNLLATLALFVAWQFLALLALLRLQPPDSALVTAGLGLVFGLVLVWVWARYLASLKYDADHRVMDAMQELDRARLEANKDPLTGLNSRSYMHERLDESLSVAIERGHLCAVLLLDLDFFKDINEALGHQLGNQLLVAMAVRLRSVVKKGDLLGYYGGDEFILVLPQINDAMAAELVARRVLAAMDEPFAVDGRSLVVSASIGVSLGPQDGRDGETLIREAESALAQSKAQGRKGYQFFTQAMNETAAARLRIDQQLRGAIDRSEMSLVYQPITHAADRSLKGMEALIRWNSPELGRMPPGEFIAIAEQIGAIGEIGNWVLREAAIQLLAWQRQYDQALVMSINVSPRQFHDGGIVPAVKSLLGRTGLKPGTLQLEVTEGLLMRSSRRVVDDLANLKKLGVHLALDDFGTGYSSLSYLRHLPFDVLKVDQSFVLEIARKAQDEALVGAMVQMGHSLGLSVVAEGVETAEQVYCLEQLAVDDFQGYYFSRPVPAREFESRFFETGPIEGRALDESIWDKL